MAGMIQDWFNCCTSETWITRESIKMFMELVGVSKSQSSADYAMLEYCIREDLRLKANRMMAVLDPIKLIIDNYPEGQVEYFDIDNNQEDESAGKRQVAFSKRVNILTRTSLWEGSRYRRNREFSVVPWK